MMLLVAIRPLQCLGLCICVYGEGKGEMTISVEKYNRLKTTVDRLQREHDRAEGALAQQMERLESDFGCKTLKAAEAKAKKLEAEAAGAEREYGEALSEFEEKWSNVLEGEAE